MVPGGCFAPPAANRATVMGGRPTPDGAGGRLWPDSACLANGVGLGRPLAPCGMPRAQAAPARTLRPACPRSHPGLRLGVVGCGSSGLPAQGRTGSGGDGRCRPWLTPPTERAGRGGPCLAASADGGWHGTGLVGLGVGDPARLRVGGDPRGKTPKGWGTLWCYVEGERG